MLLIKASVVEEEPNQPRNYVTQSTHMIEGVTVASLSASHQRKTSAARDRQYQNRVKPKIIA